MLGITWVGREVGLGLGLLGLDVFCFFWFVGEGRMALLGCLLRCYIFIICIFLPSFQLRYELAG